MIKKMSTYIIKKIETKVKIQEQVSSFNPYCLVQFALTEPFFIEADWDQVLLRFIALETNKYVNTQANFGKLVSILKFEHCKKHG